MILLQIIYLIFLLTAILRCLYFWQLKEYRIDRFAEFLKTSQSGQYWLPTRWFLRPKLTLKILILVCVSLYFAQIVIQFQPSWLFLIIAYLAIPLFSALAVFLLKPLTDLSIDFVVFLAKIKLHFLPKSLIVIGVTGSFGKTSTKEILAHLLSAGFSVCKTSGTNNTLIGVALTILKQLRHFHDFFIVEMGAYKQGEIKQICDLVRPSVGILTGVGTQHLGLFGGQTNLIKAKSELLQSLKPGSLAFLNGESPLVRSLAPQFPQLKLKFYFQPKKFYPTNLLGKYQQVNLVGAMAVARYFKLPQKLILSRLTTIPSFKTMLTKKIGINRSVVLDSSYSANLDGFLNLIESIQPLKFSQKILITSGIIELGSKSAAIHQQIGQAAAAVFDKIYLTKSDLLQFFPTAVYLSQPHQLIIKPKTLIVLVSRLPKQFVNFLCPNQS